MKARSLIVGAVGAILLAGAATLVLPAAVTAQQPAPATAPPHHEHPLPSRHIEGRIAFMRAELKITTAQQAQWDRVADIMRASAKRKDQMFQQMRATRDQPQTAMDKLDRRVVFIEAQAAEEKTFADAFRPLYQSLSDDQKKSADELFGRSRHGGWRR
jgi:Spy/CpxP family protein refolding chaperone